MTPQQRYESDPQFRTIVDLFESLIRRAQYTPTELREAAMLAAVHFEQQHIRPRYCANPDGSVTVDDRAIRMDSR